MSNTAPVRDPLSPLAREVLSLFSEALADVRFPDIDLAVLASAAEDLRGAQRDAEQLESRVTAARAVVAAQAEALTAQALRALAYARVFAESAPDVAHRVAAIEQQQLASLPHPEGIKRRGRPRKTEPEETLFTAAAPSLEIS